MVRKTRILISLYAEDYFRNPQSAIRNPQSAIRNPQSAIRNPQSAIRNPQSSFVICAHGQTK
jgi:major type 1 subunit fimbrin (pilin)